MECSNGYVQVDVDDRVATIVMNGETDANAIDLLLAQDFREAVQWVEHSEVQTVIIRGAGGIYCAGGDLAEVFERVSRFGPNIWRGLSLRSSERHRSSATRGVHAIYIDDLDSTMLEKLLFMLLLVDMDNGRCVFGVSVFGD